MMSHAARPGARRARLSEPLVRIALVVASVVAGAALFTVAEVGLRLWDPDYLAHSRGLLVNSDRYGWALRRDVSVVLDGALYNVNRRGYRGREVHPVAPPSAQKRVVVLGDSVAFGLGVSDFDTFASALDARPNGLEVVNLAVQGYGPDQELLVLQDVGIGLAPDVVLLALCAANDFADVMLSTSLYNEGHWKPRFRLDEGELALEGSPPRESPLRLRRLLADHSHLVGRLASLSPRPSPPGDGGWHRRFSEAMRDEDESLRLTLAILGRMRRMCEARGIRFVVAVFPHAYGFRTPPPLVGRLGEALASEGTLVIDIASGFRTAGLRWRHVALDTVGHLGPVGHAVAADVIERALTREPSSALAAGAADAGEPSVRGS